MGVCVCGAWRVRDGGVIISTHKVFGLQQTRGFSVLVRAAGGALDYIINSFGYYVFPYTLTRCSLCYAGARRHGDFAARDYCVSASVVLHDVGGIRADRLQGALFDRHFLTIAKICSLNMNRNRNAFIISLTVFSENIFPSNLCE